MIIAYEGSSKFNIEKKNSSTHCLFSWPPHLWIGRMQNYWILGQSGPEDFDYFFIKIDRNWIQIYVLYISENIVIIIWLLTLLCIDKSGFHSYIETLPSSLI